jgi:mRNA-degrading endonuclease RelE of RelBE toxin-antitoxin system
VAYSLQIKGSAARALEKVPKVYEAIESRLVILVVRVAHRREAYRRLR